MDKVIPSEKRWALTHRTAALLSHDQKHSQRDFQIPGTLFPKQFSRKFSNRIEKDTSSEFLMRGHTICCVKNVWRFRQDKSWPILMHFLCRLPNCASFLRPVPPRWGFQHSLSAKNRFYLKDLTTEPYLEMQWKGCTKQWKSPQANCWTVNFKNAFLEEVQGSPLSLEFYFFFLSLLHPLILLGAKSVGSLLKCRILNRYMATYSMYLITAIDAADKPSQQVRSIIHYHSKLFRLFLLIHAVAVFCTSSRPLLAAVTTLVVLPVICNLSNMIEPYSFV